MLRCILATLSAMFAVCGLAVAGDRTSQQPVPSQFLIGRRTFFDMGPPFEFYEVFSVRSVGTRTSIERATLAPPGHACTQPATAQTAAVSITESVADLLGGTNPCGIPEKDLRKEIKRCRKCLVFSGADVAMQVQCGDQSRRIRMDILDRDIFAPNPRTPRHTSWTMALLSRLDQALGSSVMQQPMFSVYGAPALPLQASTTNALLENLADGKYDALFSNASHKPSELLRQAQIRPPEPSVELLSSAPITPASYTLPKYPPLARLGK